MRTTGGGPMLTSLTLGFSPFMKPTVMRANPDEDNYLLESRVRENRMHGSVGGEDVSPSLPNYVVGLLHQLTATTGK